jgi:hypothetical protein
MSCTTPFRCPNRTLLRLLAPLLVLVGSSSLQAESPHKTALRATYTREELENSLTSTPVRLPGGSTITIITPSQWSDMAADLLSVITQTNATHAALFSQVPAFKTSIRLMDEETFFSTTGAPKWTNALFLRGQIIIPLSLTETIDRDNVRRSVKHEYTHALLSAISGGRIPGWIDEGMAQWMEGGEHPALHKALRQWLTTNDPIPLRLLQGGFTRLPTHMVAAAYAQSLVTVQALLRTYGYERIAVYLHALREGRNNDDAFRIAFGLSASQLELRLNRALQRWSGTQRSPHIQMAAYDAPKDQSFVSSRSSLGSR